MSVIATIKIQDKPPWKVKKGHPTHRGGAGVHDNRPKRVRTRSAQFRKALED